MREIRQAEPDIYERYLNGEVEQFYKIYPKEEYGDIFKDYDVKASLDAGLEYGLFEDGCRDIAEGLHNLLNKEPYRAILEGIEESYYLNDDLKTFDIYRTVQEVAFYSIDEKILDMLRSMSYLNENTNLFDTTEWYGNKPHSVNNLVDYEVAFLIQQYVIEQAANGYEFNKTTKYVLNRYDIFVPEPTPTHNQKEEAWLWFEEHENIRVDKRFGFALFVSNGSDDGRWIDISDKQIIRASEHYREWQEELKEEESNKETNITRMRKQ